MGKTSKLMTAVAVIACSIAAPSVQAAVAPSPMASDSKLRILACDTSSSGNNASNAGLLNLNTTTLQATLVDGAHQASCGSRYIDYAAFNPDDAKIYTMVRDGNTPLTYAKIGVFDMVDGSRSADQSFYLDTAPSTPWLHNIALAINPQDATEAYAYDITGVGTSPTTHGFYSINLTTFQLHEITNNLSVSVKQMAFSPSGTLYAWDDTNSRLVSISSTGAVTTVPDTTWGDGRLDIRTSKFNGMAFDSQGNLFITTDKSSETTNAQLIVATPSATAGQFNTPTIVAGANPAGGNYVNTPWTQNLGVTVSGNTTALGTIGMASFRAPIIITYGKLQVKYDANGGKAAWKSNRFMPPSMLLASGLSSNAAITLPSATRTGYTFNGWFDAASGGTKIGVAGDSYTPAGSVDINMYAQWTAIPTTPLANTGGDAPLGILAFGLVALGAAVIVRARALWFAS